VAAPGFIYWTTTQHCRVALRQLEGDVPQAGCHGLQVWQEPFVALRAPMLTNLRMARSNSRIISAWTMALVRRAHVHVRPGRSLRRPLAAELPRVPARQKPGSFNLDR